MSHSSEPCDDELVRRAQRGDRAAVVELYRRYVNEIYGYAYSQMGQAQDAEDVTSETFLRLVHGLDSFRGEASFRTWLYAIARNQVRDHWRRNGRQPLVGLELHELELAAVEAGPAGPANPRTTALGRAVLAQLPANYRRVLELRIVDEQSIRATAEAMGTSEANVKVLQHRALKRATQIAEHMSEQMNEGVKHEPPDDC